MKIADVQTTIQTAIAAVSALSGISVYIDDPETAASTFEADVEKALSEDGLVIIVGTDVGTVPDGEHDSEVLGQAAREQLVPVTVLQNTAVRKVQFPALTLNGVCDTIIQEFVGGTESSDEVRYVDNTGLEEVDGSLMRVVMLAAQTTYSF